MKAILILSFISNILYAVWNGYNKIAFTNEIKLEAEQAYKWGKFQKAIREYETLITKYKMKDEYILLNLAHCYYNIHDTVNALANYKLLLHSENNKLASVAYLQSGIIKAHSKKIKEAMNSFKEALKIDPSNEAARYNYELLKKFSSNNNNNNSSDQKASKQNKEEEHHSSQQSQGGFMLVHGKSKGKKNKQAKPDQSENNQKELSHNENGQEKKDDLRSKRLSEMNLDDAKARMILEAMRQAEIQYYQQLQRKNNKDSVNTSQNDW